ncbi:MAG: nucleotidyl transferase AbiEii/AbiGii toxin family protein [Bacteroidales bacterium]|nr:nucleotidyl transferase AbiEii/AbiGii toxin family protein [Bacteroidales bacterium]MBR6931662.1 nucleotidyl transferase AbiEii/AbiGii toxin family protein [Bacteroidales bacterium]
MRLYYDTVSTPLLSILRRLMSAEVLNDFRLVGGTALALQRGHRMSVDIDLFTDLDYANMPVADMRNYLEKEFPVHKGTESMEMPANGYHIFLSEGQEPPIKVDFFYTEPFIFPAIEEDGLRIADQREIAAMKLGVIGNQIYRQKDYWDVHDLLEDYSLSEMIQWALQRDPYSFTKEDIIKGLQQVNQVEESPMGIVSLKPLSYWELKVLDLIEEMKILTKCDNLN